jgi:hypothetical protein
MKVVNVGLLFPLPSVRRACALPGPQFRPFVSASTVAFDGMMLSSAARFIVSGGIPLYQVGGLIGIGT